jgi:hypothetical protein
MADTVKIGVAGYDAVRMAGVAGVWTSATRLADHFG